MEKVNDFRKKVNSLVGETAQLRAELTKTYFNAVAELEEDLAVEDESGFYLDYRNEITGDCKAVKILAVKKDGYIKVETEEDGNIKEIALHDLASMEDVLELLVFMSEVKIDKFSKELNKQMDWIRTGNRN